MKTAKEAAEHPPEGEESALPKLILAEAHGKTKVPGPLPSTMHKLYDLRIVYGMHS